MMDVSVSDASDRVSAAKVQQYLRRNGYPDAIVSELQPLGQHGHSHVKSYGYGQPLVVAFRSQGKARHLVLRTMLPDAFGHDRRADRVGRMVLAHDTFDRMPRHLRALDVGTFDEAGNLVSFARGEPFLVTEYAAGDLYANDLQKIATHRSASAFAIARAHALADYLAELHQPTAKPEEYQRSIRDIVGSSEGILGLVDSYPESHATVPRARAEKIEIHALRWRSRLRAYGHRARRTHGDFHPFNIRFREGCDISVVDASLGGTGDPADDVTCLSLNYLFFALVGGDAQFDGALRMTWDAFWGAYLGAADDTELLSIVPLFFAWRALVVASPVWYPGIADRVRDRIVTFAERLLEGETFSPDAVDALLR
jgi:hypothetical protein